MTFRLSPMVLVLIVALGLAGCIGSTDASICNPVGGCEPNPNYR
jgi:hypothetical protein